MRESISKHPNKSITLNFHPTFELHQKVGILSAGLILPVVITKRIAKADIDSGITVYSYNLKHDYHGNKIAPEDIWTWEDIKDDSLLDMVYYAKLHYEKTGHRYGKYLRRN